MPRCRPAPPGTGALSVTVDFLNVEGPVRSRGFALALPVLVVALLLLVALASRPADSVGGGPAGAQAAAHVLLDVLLYLVVVVLALGIVIIVWALWPDGTAKRPRKKPRPWWHSAVAALVTLLGMTAALWWVYTRRRQGGGLGHGRAGLQPPAPGSLPATRTQTAGTMSVDWIALAVVLTLLVALAIVAWVLLRPRRSTSLRERLAAAIEEVLDDAIGDVLREPNPREAVIAAWARLERVLLIAGVPRRDAEAPVEYVTRVLGELTLSARSLRRLADLYEWARFSTHPVTADMRDEAVGSLIAVRDQLRDLRDAEQRAREQGEEHPVVT